VEKVIGGGRKKWDEILRAEPLQPNEIPMRGGGGQIGIRGGEMGGAGIERI